MWLFSWMPIGWWIRLPWPWSLALEIAAGIVMNLAPLTLGLGIYLLIVKSFSLRAFTAGFATAIAALAVSDVAITFLRGNQYRLSWILPAVLYSLVLLISIWTAQRKASRTAT